VLIHVVGLFLFGRYACRLLGPGAGVAATVALALFPAALGHSFNDPKDWPCALFYGVAVLAAGVGLVEGRTRSLIASALYAGHALSGKANGLFALVTVALWAPVAYLLLYRPQGRPFAPRLALLLAAPYLAVATFVLLWPWLWYPEQPQTSWSHPAEYVRFVLERGYGPRKTWVAYPFTCVAITTPPIVLVAAALGLATGWRGDRRRRAIWGLLVIWFLLPLLRIAKPRSNFYDANRHFLEYVPALCCLAAVGFVAAVRRARRFGEAFVARRGWAPRRLGRRQRVRLLVELSAPRDGVHPQPRRRDLGRRLRQHGAAREDELGLLGPHAGVHRGDGRLRRHRRSGAGRVRLRHAPHLLLLARNHPGARGA
jgi:hypothetical protein